MMNGIPIIQYLLKQRIPLKCRSFAKNRYNESQVLQYKSVPQHNFLQCQAIHQIVNRLNVPDTHNETTRKKISNINQFKDVVKNGPSLSEFIPREDIPLDDINSTSVPYIKDIHSCNQKVYFEVYGCQMNVNDTEVIWSILKSSGYRKAKRVDDADVVLLVTCSIRDGAEQKVWNKLDNLNGIRKKRKRSMKIGLLGCMAERLKEKILDKGKLVDVIAGPDSYKDLPRLLSVPDRETAINVLLSFDETYADITPVRLNPDSVSAFVTIMRGCDNMCTYCIVPFTRGRERSRPIESIVNEIQHLSDSGVKEVTLLGQNVNSYRDLSQSEFYVPNNVETYLARGFKTVYKKKKGGLRFSDLLDKVSLINPEIRIRFTSPHPKDFPDEVLQLVAERPNICKELHLPAQSGNSAVLERMRRGYTREAYLDLVRRAREIIPNLSLSTDFIAGFCGETEEEFADTLSLIELVKYNKAFLFSYSLREKTTAHRRLQDDVEQSVKTGRLQKMITLHNSQAEELNKSQIGQLQVVLLEKVSKRSSERFQGRNDGGMRVLIPNESIPSCENSDTLKPISGGDYVLVQISEATSHSLLGIPLYHSSISERATTQM